MGLSDPAQDSRISTGNTIPEMNIGNFVLDLKYVAFTQIHNSTLGNQKLALDYLSFEFSKATLMLEILFYVGDKFKILLTDLAVFVTNIRYLLTSPATNQISHTI